MEEQLDHEEAFPRLSRELLAVLDAACERRAPAGPAGLGAAVYAELPV